MDFSSKHAPVVYFVLDRRDHSVKIGTTTDLRSRRNRLGLMAELEILGYLEGGRELEKEIHARFQRYNRFGEWFTAAPAILDFVRKNGKPYTHPVKPTLAYRSADKVVLGVKLPLALRTAVKLKAARDRRSVSATVARLLCLGLDIDPALHGLESEVETVQPN